MVGKKPFAEMILNISNALTEFMTILIFIILAITLFNIPNELLNKIDDCLVIFVETALAIQMTSSIIVFIRTIYFYIKMKIKNRHENQNKIPITSVNEFIDGNKSKD